MKKRTDSDQRTFVNPLPPKHDAMSCVDVCRPVGLTQTVGAASMMLTAPAVRNDSDIVWAQLGSTIPHTARFVPGGLRYKNGFFSSAILK
jgi:hypothetical protein